MGLEGTDMIKVSPPSDLSRMEGPTLASLKDLLGTEESKWLVHLRHHRRGKNKDTHTLFDRVNYKREPLAIGELVD
jgi:hypothetical protein